MRQHYLMTVDLADRIIGSMLANGDWNPDVIVVAADVAHTSRQPIHTKTVVETLEAEGHTVNEDWTVDWRDE